MEDLDMYPCSYTHLNFDKGAKNLQWRKDRLFNKCCCENRLIACRKLELGPCLSSCTSINSTRIMNLNIRPETLKSVKEITGNTLKIIDIGKDSAEFKRLSK
jgi:hypothetical protein